MSSRIASWRIGFVRLDYVRPVHWAAHSEEHGDCIILELMTDDGVRGAAEAIMRPKWHETTRNEIESVLLQGLLPSLGQIDWTVQQSLEQCFGRFRQNGFVCALVDQALWDIRAQMSSQPLWQALGGHSAKIAVSFTLTRTAPAIMAREAAAMRSQYGFTAFKVKTGQGLEIDRCAIAEIRASLGHDAVIMADSNRAHDHSDVANMSSMLADAGVVYFEDPCAFIADQTFTDAQANSSLPILVDNQSRSFEAAKKFIDLGAQALSVKTMKTGHTESLAIAALAGAHHAKIAVGISASAGAGAMHTLSLAAAMPDHLVCLACEETFFLYLRHDLIATPLKVHEGCVDMSSVGFVAPLIDWQRMDMVIRK